MIANMNEKANRNKLLAAFLALAMVAVCGAQHLIWCRI